MSWFTLVLAYLRPWLTHALVQHRSLLTSVLVHTCLGLPQSWLTPILAYANTANLCRFDNARLGHHQNKSQLTNPKLADTRPWLTLVLPDTRPCLTHALAHTDLGSHRPWLTQTLAHTDLGSHRPWLTQTLTHTDLG